MECSEGTAGKECIYAGSALKLQSLLDCSEATLRRYTTYLAYVGFIDRLNGRGARDGLRLRLRTETPIAEINDKIEVVGRHHAFFRSTVDTDAQLLRSELSEVTPSTSVGQRSELSEVPETTLNTERSEPVAPVELHTHARARARVNYQDSITSQSPGLNVQEELKETTKVVSGAKPRRAPVGAQAAIATLVVAMHEHGNNRYQPNDKDVGTVRRMPGFVAEHADEIAACWDDIVHKRYGNDYLRQGLSVHRILNDWLPGYQAWVSDGRPPPKPAYAGSRSNYAGSRSNSSNGYNNFGAEEHYRGTVIGDDGEEEIG